IDKEVEDKIKNLSSAVGELLDQNHIDRALKKILEFSAHFNQYFQHKEPWKKGKGTNTCVFLSVNAARSIAIALVPFLPDSAEKIWNQLNFQDKVYNQRWDSISDLGIKTNHKLGVVSPLFKKVEESEIKLHKAKLGI
ncbi:MAG TPA: class I tRNA ligase family protein, partial [Nitrosarchaeum sp.]|nr:class I tRNA ligase family protein [Nitrosarchaeum sp.]